MIRFATMGPAIVTVIRSFKAIGSKTLVMPAIGSVYLPFDVSVTQADLSGTALSHLRRYTVLQYRELAGAHSCLRVTALAALGPDHLALSGAVSDKLTAQPYQKLTPQTVHIFNVSDEGR